MQPAFRFPRSTVFLMAAIFAGLLLTIAKASRLATPPGSVWPALISILLFMLLIMCTIAVVVWGILHGLRRSGVRRLEDV